MYLVHRAYLTLATNPNGSEAFFCAFSTINFNCKIDRYLFGYPDTRATQEERRKKDIIGHIIITKQQIKNI